jgi:hypothetical protein
MMKSKEKKVSSFRGRVQESAKKQNSGGGGSTSYLNLPNGVTKLVFDDTVKKVQMDFMPYIVSDAKHPDKAIGVTVGEQWYRRPFKLHRSIGADNKSYVCPTSIGKRCPICEYQKELFLTDKAGAVKLYGQDRELYAPIPLNSKKHEAVPYVWDMSTKMFNSELEIDLADDPDNEIFPDLEEGKTLEIKFKWDTIGKGKPFPEVTDIKFLDRDEAYDESILEDVPDLDAIINDSVLSYDELKDALFAMDKEEDGGDLEDDDEKPKSKASSKRAPVEEEKPKKSVATTSKKPAKKVVEIPTWEELNEMDLDELIEVADANDVDISDCNEDEDEIKAFIASELEIEKPARKSSRTAPAAKTATKKPVDVPDPEEEREYIPKRDRCVACEGTGKNSKGKDCPICEGTGRKPKEEDPEDEKPISKKKVEATPTTTSRSKGSCPHGHIFGKDSEKFDDCDSCKVWEACADEKEKLGKK